MNHFPIFDRALLVQEIQDPGRHARECLNYILIKDAINNGGETEDILGL